ncbi:MAG TPA: hypothetical protein DCQ98_18420 [Planctomycetaceae bacterium]|nr:hypothetical protein [Planctomycetaceae bacterium]
MREVDRRTAGPADDRRQFAGPTAILDRPAEIIRSADSAGIRSQFADRVDRGRWATRIDTRRPFGAP